MFGTVTEIDIVLCKESVGYKFCKDPQIRFSVITCLQNLITQRHTDTAEYTIGRHPTLIIGIHSNCYSF